MKNKLEKKISQLLSWLVIIVLLPLVITIICQGMRLDSLIKALPIDASFDTGTPGTDMAAATESLSSESTPEYAPSATESPEALSPGKPPRRGSAGSRQRKSVRRRIRHGYRFRQCGGRTRYGHRRA